MINNKNNKELTSKNFNNCFTVPVNYIENDINQLDLELKEISNLLFLVFNFHFSGDNKIEVTLFPYQLNFIRHFKHPWNLVSCKVHNSLDDGNDIVFSFASSQDSRSYQNCSGLYQGKILTIQALHSWLNNNTQFLTSLRNKKNSYNNNFFQSTT